MLLLILMSFSAGIEAGVCQPFVDNLDNGTIYRVFSRSSIGLCDAAFSIQGVSCTGKNHGYSFTTYGFRAELDKAKWRFAPFVEVGVDYVARELNASKEWGVVCDYAFGFMLNFSFEALRLYPKFFYDGTTDFRKHAAFIGIKLGIGYEI